MSERDHQVVLVTGGNAGIGLHVARGLARAGERVLLGSRDPQRGTAASEGLAREGLRVDPISLDVTDDATIAAVARYVETTYGRLDVLINNAAIVGDGRPASEVTRAEMMRTFDTNVAGVAATTNALLPLLRRSSRPRILNVSSELGSTRLVNDPDWQYASVAVAAYQASKAALDMLTVMYAKELAAERIAVLSVSPGYRQTGLNGGRPAPGAGDPAEGAAGIVELARAEEVPTGRFLDDAGGLVRW